MERVHFGIAILSSLLLIGLESAVADDLPKLVTEEFMVDSDQAGIQLYVRNKHPADMGQVPLDHILLYVHGATQPSESTFDLALEGFSWMDYIAGHGWDVYLMDVRGYGGSTRPPEVDQPTGSAPIVWTHMKVRDVDSVVNFILERRNAPKIHLLGWSWGTVVMPAFAVDNGDKVSSLVLLSPVWCSGPCAFDPALAESLAASRLSSNSLAPYVASSMAAARKRLQEGAPADKWDDLMPPKWYEAWSTATLATDPVGAKQEPPVMRSPAGVGQDFSDYWASGKSYYDPNKVTVPTLVIVGEWDAGTPPDNARALYESLKGSPERRFVQIGEGTHIVMLEKNRMQLFQEVQRFLASQPH